ncbi:MAG: Hint domain-containing protein [Paracoccus sp. (in: a-proteobacteria)]|nr:Hint domain-containing protein [Paracoccus sp. (in: a-proteobacteria)]
MPYVLEAFTFSSPIPSQSGIPFYSSQGMTNISLADATHESIYLNPISRSSGNPMQNFRSFHYNVYGQGLLKETVIGGVTMPEGALMTFNRDRIGGLEDPDTGAQYLVVFPHLAEFEWPDPYNTPEIGNRTTIFVMPSQAWTPPFDPNKLYNFYFAQDFYEIPLPVTEIPPGYLGTICFAAGTLIATANGARPVESLRAGDLVLTRDRGLRPLGWAGRSPLSAHQLDLAPNLRPVLIRAGALAPGLPARDLVVSPQHRVLIRSAIAERMTGTPEALVAAKHLIAMPGIEVLPGEAGVVYHHLLFDRHELVLSEGTWTESLFTGPQALKTIGPAGRREIRALFPQLFTDAEPEGARPFMKGREARELTRRHLKNARPLLAGAD